MIVFHRMQTTHLNDYREQCNDPYINTSNTMILRSLYYTFNAFLVFIIKIMTILAFRN